jgi:hypothetical protein
LSSASDETTNGPLKRAVRFEASRLVESGRLNGVRLQTLLALDDSEADSLSFLQALESLHLDGAKMHKHIFAIFTANKAKALGIIEPFHGTDFTVCHYCLTPRNTFRSGVDTPLMRRLVARRKRGDSDGADRTDLQHQATIHGDLDKLSGCHVNPTLLKLQSFLILR